MLDSQMSQPNSNNATLSNHKDSAELPDALLEAISAYTDKRKKPKRNRSAFILYSIDIRKKRQHEGLDDLNPNDKFVKIAQLWKEASEKERRFYEEKAREEKERYTSELNDFCRIFPAEPIQRPRNHIKKPCNAYGYYLKDIKEEIREKDPELRMCEVLRIVGEKWKHLNPEQKQKYEEKAEAGRKKFKAEVSKQMQAMKKVKPNPKISTEKEKGKSSKISEQGSLVCKDPFIVDLEDQESREKEQFQASPIDLSSKRDQENILPMINQSSMHINIPQRPNRLLESLTQNQLFPSAAETLNYIASFPPQILNANTSQIGTDNFSKDTFFALKELYMKVEQLRNNILLQLRSVSNGDQAFLLNYGRLPLFDQSNQNIIRDQTDSTRILSEKNEFKEEEF